MNLSYVLYWYFFKIIIELKHPEDSKRFTTRTLYYYCFSVCLFAFEPTFPSRASFKKSNIVDNIYWIWFLFLRIQIDNLIDSYSFAKPTIKSINIIMYRSWIRASFLLKIKRQDLTTRVVFLTWYWIMNILWLCFIWILPILMFVTWLNKSTLLIICYILYCLSKDSKYSTKHGICKYILICLFLLSFHTWISLCSLGTNTFQVTVINLNLCYISSKEAVEI